MWRKFRTQCINVFIFMLAIGAGGGAFAAPTSIDRSSTAAAYGGLEQAIAALKSSGFGEYEVLTSRPKVNTLKDLKLSYLSRQILSRGRSKISLLVACADASGAPVMHDHVGDADEFSKSVIGSVLKAAAAQCAGAPAAAPASPAAKPAQPAAPSILGDGVALSEIEMVVFDFRQYTGIGGLMELDEDIYVLFKDGYLYKNPSVALADLDPNASRAAEPGKWYLWRRSGGAYQKKPLSRSKDSWDGLDVRIKIPPAPKGLRLSGSFTYARASGSVWNGSTVSRGGMTFTRGGQYEGWRAVQYGGGQGPQVFAAQYCDKDKSVSSVSSGASPGVIVGQSSKGDGCPEDPTGVYKIDGYTIEMRSNSGLVTRLPFYQWKADRIFIGAQSYRRK